MAHYNPTRLLIYCTKYAQIEFTQKKKRITTEKITERAFLIKDEYIKQAKIEFSNNPTKYNAESINPKKLFRLKKQPSYGFYKEYLENETIKKYVPYFFEIWQTNLNINELNEETKKFTNGKAQSFQEYYNGALKENFNRIINKIAIQLILKDLEKQIKK